MEIVTNRLIIKPCEEELLPVEMDRGPHVQHYLEEVEVDSDLKGWGVWLVFRKDDEQLIGDIGFKGKPENGIVEVGYGILKEVQGKGYAAEAVEALLNWAFKSGEVQKVIAECLKTNTASIKVLEKLSMTKVEEDELMMYWERHIFH
ncbi:GNAT family N-acetyltransferase [Metabacillus sp. B2-18]|uniref:GNAT family N-acetyltransferase n=1 Tax=Metabacillus sp. B2-18 TaxID=2897333 RepID=UPI001E5139A0|nr:GNAT family N-acetyltransferase [Metabacillus sp. B2-18]UGB30173.1 GNAT family N-acetyltransferase [Metabacillus sp. B2-18]